MSETETRSRLHRPSSHNTIDLRNEVLAMIESLEIWVSKDSNIPASVKAKINTCFCALGDLRDIANREIGAKITSYSADE